MDVLALNNMLDECYKTNKWREGYDRIKEYEDKATDPELLWRMIRSYYQVGKYMPRDKNEAEFLATKGLEISDRALKINGNHFNIRRVSYFNHCQQLVEKLTSSCTQLPVQSVPCRYIIFIAMYVTVEWHPPKLGQ